MRMLPSLVVRLGPALAAALAAVPAAAQDGRGWNVQVTPYVWGSGVSGELTPLAGGPTLDFDESLSDVLEDLDGAFFLSAYARSERWVVLGDISSATSSREGTVPPGLPAEGEVSQRSVTLAVGYRAVSGPRATVDLLAGARFWDVEVSAAAPAVGLSAGADVSFSDPILGARVNLTLAPRLSAILYADVGGFGTGSEATNQVVATLNYAVTDRFYVSSGWRRLYVDYDSGGTDFEAALSGPLLGVTWRF
ncbi:hypothetical protein [Rubellimicrobium aerolatum]|uniref:Outer membrane protein beta-barrel domain-containing protein n=1 Tax=Rubellimicrobium aerolatum TaxID=490979 RepID=A0ABW0SC90_9RHOB|nr:hypothetical protein [Rubellimicrobium aerolatum]MBP1806204.1 hypothetical protein [Rubellimicrobium aerolatum]